MVKYDTFYNYTALWNSLFPLANRCWVVHIFDFLTKQLFLHQHIGHVSLQTSTTVWVYIIDENDNAPAFAAKEYVTILTEGPDTVGATIATVTASDPDEGLNGTLRYAIALGNVAQTFSISPTTVNHMALENSLYCM